MPRCRFFFEKGECRLGADCKFSHDAESSGEPKKDDRKKDEVASSPTKIVTKSGKVLFVGGGAKEENGEKKAKKKKKKKDAAEKAREGSVSPSASAATADDNANGDATLVEEDHRVDSPSSKEEKAESPSPRPQVAPPSVSSSVPSSVPSHSPAAPVVHAVHDSSSKKPRPEVDGDPGTFAFMSNATFLKAPLASATSEIVLAGVCWDGSTTNRAGARHGPAGIRRASHMLCDGEHPVFNLSPLEPKFHFADAGDLMLPNTSLERMREVMVPMVSSLLKRHHHAVFLGGDHSITLPILRAYRAHYGVPLAVLHFDAHCDTWVDHFGEPSGHGTWVYEAIQEGLVVKECFWQVGIRSAGNREAREYVKSVGGAIFGARELRGLENKVQLASMLKQIRDRHKSHGSPPVYLSLDIDCLDPAFAPGTGTPEPGGLTTNQVLTILEELVPDMPFVGADFVEVSPPYDHAEITSLAASHFCWTYLSALLSRKGKK